jgi:hypothetical protein
MIARVESAQSWLENVTHQMNNVRPPLPPLPPLIFFGVASIDVIRRAVGEYRWNNRSPQAVSLSLSLLAGVYSGCRYVTNTGRATAEDAAQIFGGRSITQTGMGKLVENVRHSFIIRCTLLIPIQYHRTSPYDAILGGAEDVMGDLGVRQALRKMPKNARL